MCKRGHEGFPNCHGKHNAKCILSHCRIAFCLQRNLDYDLLLVIAYLSDLMTAMMMELVGKATKEPSVISAQLDIPRTILQMLV